MSKIGTFKMREALPTWKEYKKYSIMGLDFDDNGNPLPRKVTRLRFTWFWLKELKRLSHCWLFGHNIIEKGHAGPDSGCITWECKRCGWCAAHTFY